MASMDRYETSCYFIVPLTSTIKITVLLIHHLFQQQQPKDLPKPVNKQINK